MDPKIPRETKAGWERRLPEIIAPWTHWRLLGDGTFLADVSADDLLGALRIVEANHRNFRVIMAARVAYDSGGKCIREDKGRFQIT